MRRSGKRVRTARLSPTSSELLIHLEVDGETVIPKTGSYVAKIENTVLANAVFPPPDEEFTLGKITRDGASVEIPFLSTSSGYKHRLVLTNRGSAAVPYTVSFTAEDGVTATAGSKATGMLPPGITTFQVADLRSPPRRSRRSRAGRRAIPPSSKKCSCRCLASCRSSALRPPAGPLGCNCSGRRRRRRPWSRSGRTTRSPRASGS